MKEIQEWNPYYIGASCSLYRPEQFYPWLYPYGSSRHYINLWNDPEQMEDVEDKKRIMEMYPLMARRLQPYVEECCDRLEYEGSPMFAVYPDKVAMFSIAKKIYEKICYKDADETLLHMIEIMVCHEFYIRRCRYRKRRKYF